MVSIWLVVFIYLLVIFIDMSFLLKNRCIKSVIVSMVMYAVSLIVIILVILDISVPSPAKAIEKIVRMII